MVATPVPNAHVAMMKELLASGDYSDFTFTCGSDTYRVHKNIVCKRSGFFERAGRFPRPVGEEASEGKVDLPQDEPEIVRLLVQYLYENDYKVDFDENCEQKRKQKWAAIDLRSQRSPGGCGYLLNFPHRCGQGCSYTTVWVCPHHRCADACKINCNFTCSTCSPIIEGENMTDPKLLLLHSKMYAIGDKYDVAGLKELARTNFCMISNKAWKDEAFAEVADHVLSSTPDSDAGLRDVLCEMIGPHVELLNKPAFADLLNKHTKFMFQVLRRVCEVKGGLKRSA
ncbi:hypothetical protein IG631_09817 [Alternaria alternata]|nr:hypothetical protein IG631_09817 [Alternaria alternata]